MFQSTRPNGARQAMTTISTGVREVSIHAPAWGATSCFRFNSDLYPVSIHAPAWGATWITSSTSSIVRCFNPRARMGRDCCYNRTNEYIDGFNPRARMGRDVRPPVFVQLISVVSIHAPAWGATSSLSLSISSALFQSTRPHGARPTSQQKTLNICSFNPRARMGRDWAA